MAVGPGFALARTLSQLALVLASAPFLPAGASEALDQRDREPLTGTSHSSGFPSTQLRTHPTTLTLNRFQILFPH